MATFGAMLALRIHGITVENIGTTSKTLPDFVEMWRSMLNDDK
jgi:3-phosphoshikimate 1-carboxyvinyltransferase